MLPHERIIQPKDIFVGSNSLHHVDPMTQRLKAQRWFDYEFNILAKIALQQINKYGVAPQELSQSRTNFPFNLLRKYQPEKFGWLIYESERQSNNDCDWDRRVCTFLIHHNNLSILEIRHSDDFRTDRNMAPNMGHGIVVQDIEHAKLMLRDVLKSISALVGNSQIDLESSITESHRTIS